MIAMRYEHCGNLKTMESDMRIDKKTCRIFARRMAQAVDLKRLQAVVGGAPPDKTFCYCGPDTATRDDCDVY